MGPKRNPCGTPLFSVKNSERSEYVDSVKSKSGPRCQRFVVEVKVSSILNDISGINNVIYN